MSTLQICFKASTKVVEVQALGDTISAGFTQIAEIPRTNALAPLGITLPFESGHDKSSTIYHHVRKALYALGVEDMSRITINMDQVFTSLTAIAVTPPTASVAHGATQQLTTAFTPSGATDQRLAYKSSNTAVATVDANGLVTTIIAGTATITVTSDEGDFTRTCVITST